jgi:hypothetical protein
MLCSRAFAQHQILGVGQDAVDCNGHASLPGDGPRSRACAISSDVQAQVLAGEPLAILHCVAEVLLQELRKSQVREWGAETGMWIRPVI